MKPTTAPPPSDRVIPVDPNAAYAGPRWSVFLALIAVGGLSLALPGSLVVGPRWLPLAIILVVSVPLILTHQGERHHLNDILGHALAAVLTLLMLWSLALLILALPAKKELPLALLRSAAALWMTNVLIFALWYWRLDAGGPHQRDRRDKHERGAFLFPQMTLDTNPEPGEEDPWRPHFIDYLFLAFNTSTAFSPTDAPVLSRWAKILCMLQSVISLTIVAILAARAINVL